MLSSLDKFLKLENGKVVRPIKKELTKPFLLNIHYLKRIPSISYAFGLFFESKLEGVITFGKPASNALCVGICGEKYKNLVYELNRLCLIHNKPNHASFLIGNSLKKLPKPLILVSYSDPSFNHIGKIYQATNWIYTGLSDPHVEWKIDEKIKHSRHLGDQFGGINKMKEKLGNKLIKKERQQKHRYIYFIGDKRFKRKIKALLKYPTKAYPKVGECEAEK